MLLYHGTSESKAKEILNHGLKPRGEAKGNWGHTIESHPEAVYLTTAYAGYFAGSAAKDGERWAIVEVDTDKLNPYLLYPDEDFIAQALSDAMDRDEHLLAKGIRKAIKGKDLIQITAWVRDNIDMYQHMWEKSIEFMGNCAYYGNIPPEAITRISLFDPKSNPMIAFSVVDPTICIMNYRLMADKYKAITKWLMGDDASFEDYVGGAPFMEAYEKMGQQDYVDSMRKQWGMREISYLTKGESYVSRP